MKKYFLIPLLLLFFLFVSVPLINAQGFSNNSVLVKPSDPKPCTAESTDCLYNPLSVNSPQALIGKIINAVLGVVGSLALLMFVYGGLTWMTSSGSQEKVKKGRDIIVWSAIGLAIIFASYGLVRILLATVK